MQYLVPAIVLAGLVIVGAPVFWKRKTAPKKEKDFRFIPRPK